VIVPYRSGQKIITDIQNKGREKFGKHDLRKLQRYIVNLRTYDFQQLQALGQIKELFTNWEMYVLSEGSYDHRFGVILNQRSEEDFII
jgi:hypothetical protein